MAPLTKDEANQWALFTEADKIIRDGGGLHALEILYDLEIQELTSALRILVNTTLAIADDEPDYRQEMEWIDEASIVLRTWKNSVQADDDGEALTFLLEEKIKTAEKVAKKQVGLENVESSDDDADFAEGQEDESDEPSPRNGRDIRRGNEVSC